MMTSLFLLHAKLGWNPELVCFQLAIPDKTVLCFPFAWAGCQMGWLAGELVSSTPGDAPLKKV